MPNVVKLHVLVVRQEREKAFQVILRDSLPFQWIPRSQVKGEYHAGDRDIVIELPMWLAREKGLAE